jgi:hypothetical protein
MTVEQQLLLGINLQHEAYRDGYKVGQIDADGNEAAIESNMAENRPGVLAHTEMTLRMLQDGYTLNVDGHLGMDIGAYIFAQMAEDMSIMDWYADTFYNSEKDYLDIEYQGGILVNPFATPDVKYLLKPIGGDLTSTQKTIEKLQSVASALSGFAPANISDITSAMMAISNEDFEGLMDTGFNLFFSKMVEKELPALVPINEAIGASIHGNFLTSLLLAFGAITIDPVTGATNYTKENFELSVAVAAEQMFLKGLQKEFRERYNIISSPYKDGGFINNMEVVVSQYHYSHADFIRIIEEYQKTNPLFDSIILIDKR